MSFFPPTALRRRHAQTLKDSYSSYKKSRIRESGHALLAKLGPGGTDSPRFRMGQDCLWNSKEQNRKWTAQLFSAPRFGMGRDCLWDSEEQHSWAKLSILCFSPRCPRGSLVPYQNEEQISCAVYSHSCSSLSQRQSCPIPKWEASVLRGSPYGENCVQDAYWRHRISRPMRIVAPMPK